MPYQNNPFRHRRYTYPDNNLLTNEPFTNNDISTESIKVSADIPLPNNKENAQGSINQKRGMSPSSIINFFKNKITIEEIILIGVIFVLLEEGIEDEFLLLMLVYILIF
jgi:hypothetical protein